MMKQMNENKQIAELIHRRREQMLVHSYIYYQLNDNIIKDRLLKYLEDTIIFSGKAVSPYLNRRVDGAKLVISRVVGYNEDKAKVICPNCGYRHSDDSELIQGQ